MRGNVGERHIVTRGVLIKLTMAIAVGGCGRPAAVLAMLHLSTLTAPSMAMAAVSLTLISRFGPLCG